MVLSLAYHLEKTISIDLDFDKLYIFIKIYIFLYIFIKIIFTQQEIKSTMVKVAS